MDKLEKFVRYALNKKEKALWNEYASASTAAGKKFGEKLTKEWENEFGAAEDNHTRDNIAVNIQDTILNGVMTIYTRPAGELEEYFENMDERSEGLKAIHTEIVGYVKENDEIVYQLLAKVSGIKEDSEVGKAITDEVIYGAVKGALPTEEDFLEHEKRTETMAMKITGIEIDEQKYGSLVEAGLDEMRAYAEFKAKKIYRS